MAAVSGDAESEPRAEQVAELAAGVRAGDRSALGRAITLVESTLPAHATQAARLLNELVCDSGGAQRVGVSGVPGVGKSTLIETLGTQLTEAGHRVAVLAVDPSSVRTGGSIMGDKTRMTALASNPAAFVRPSPTAGELGGVHRSTRESVLLCEAAGYDVVLVETVGVGQSETVVAQMVDCFVLLLLPGAGDDLQGIKKGILELADIVTVNKTDAAAAAAASAVSDYRLALALTAPPDATDGWKTPVLSCSATTGEGVSELWEQVCAHRVATERSGTRERRRADQRVQWLHQMLNETLARLLRDNPAVPQLLAQAERDVRAGVATPAAAVANVMAVFTAPS